MSSYNGVIDRFEGEFAIISVNSNTLEVPKTMIPEGVREGSSIVVSFMSDKEADQDRQEVARNLLNEILKEE